MSPHRITRRALLKASATAGALLLAACGPRALDTPVTQPTTPPDTTAPTPVPATPAPKEPVKISMSTFGAPFEQKLYTDYYIPRFKDVAPHIEVEFLAPADYIADIVRLSAAGEPPDVIRHVGTQLEWAFAGIVAPLDDLMAAAGFHADDFYPETWVGSTFKGEIYAVSQSPNFLGLWFNPEAFDEAGLPYPDNDYTFDRLMADAQALTKKDASGNVERYGFVQDWAAAPFIIGTWVYSHGGRLLDEAGTKPVFDSPEVIEALKNMQTLIKEGWAASTAVMGGVGSIAWFTQGKAALFGQGTHMASIGTAQADPDFRFIGTTWPKAKVKAAVGTDVGFCLAAGSKHKPEAFDYLSFMLNKENLLEYWQQLWVALPARKSVFNDPAIKNIKGIPEFSPSLTRGEQEFKEKCQWQIDAYNMGMVYLDWNSPWLAKMNPIIQETIEAVTLETAPANPAEACKTANEKFLQIIRDNPI